jgi:flagellar motor switch protein FliN/FliY
MRAFLDCWVRVAGDLFHQALAGEPELAESQDRTLGARSFGLTATLDGDEAGRFTVSLDSSILEAPLLGEGALQQSSWEELLRETFEAACGELLATRGIKCQVEKVEEATLKAIPTHGFQIRSGERKWNLLVSDETGQPRAASPEGRGVAPSVTGPESAPTVLTPGLELLLDIELEASLRFGCREMPLGEILDLGPGDVVQLDRHVADPVDLIVGDKIVARGEVVLVNGNFGLRVSEVAAPQRRLESIRCLF